MPSLNKVYLMGNLTRTPELRYTPGGAAVCEFGLAINRRYVSNGVQKDDTTFVDVNVWQKQAEICSRRLQKGSLAMIEGRLKTDQWEDKDTGKKRSKILIVAERVHFLAMPPRGEHQEEYEAEGHAQQPSRQGYQQRPPQAREAVAQQSAPPPPPPPPLPEDEYVQTEEDTDENVPF